jgi:hypothetical protein
MTMRSIICHSCHRFCTHRILYPIVLAYILDTLYNIGVGYNKTKKHTTQEFWIIRAGP